MAQCMPVSLDEMKNIDGCPETKVKKFGEEFLQVTQNYASLSKLSPSLLFFFRLYMYDFSDCLNNNCPVFFSSWVRTKL